MPTPEMLDAVSVGAVDRDVVCRRAIALWDSMVGAAPAIENVYESVVLTSIPNDELELVLERALARSAEHAVKAPEQAVAEYFAGIRANLYPKETCPHCGGSDAPYDQVDCVELPCPVGRDFKRPPLEEVIRNVEALLGIASAVGAKNVSEGVLACEVPELLGDGLRERTYADEPLSHIKALGALVQDAKGIEISGSTRKVSAFLMCAAAVPELVARIEELEAEHGV
ncbi:hypothetical protein [Pseudomonas lurida]|uniref:hypothetical protein n=1 Tax=Pseudomonas lurida TaxID=244566 RepID=UPI00177A92CE|nr:hypothetical protein [Pseudomonas lurida]MBD8671572.1 hypothetical protein [Pseudomonas lurida]